MKSANQNSGDKHHGGVLKTSATRHYELTASEFDWNISAGKTVKAWGFNQTLPGDQSKKR